MLIIAEVLDEVKTGCLQMAIFAAGSRPRTDFCPLETDFV